MKKVSPKWLADVVATPYEDRFVVVDSCKIHYQYWGTGKKKRKPGLLLIHGFSAHSHWWDMIAPHFLADYDVAAMDLSGFGDSEWRKSYDFSSHGKEIAQVIADAGFTNPTVIAHSMGSGIALNSFGSYISSASPIIFIDPITFPGGAKDGKDKVNQERQQAREPKYTETKELLVEKFRFFNGDDLILPHVRTYIASHSIKQTDMGWTLKFDLDYIHKREEMLSGKSLVNYFGKQAAIFGGASEFGSKAHQEYFARLLGPNSEVVSIKGSDHNVMLDSPLELIQAISDILSSWEIASVTETETILSDIPL